MNDFETIDNPDDTLLARVGLTRDEFSRLCEKLQRSPNIIEMGMVGALWSEHCGYKSSKLHLQKLPTSGERVLQGPGENAGVVQVNEDVAVVFKIESHNHPSAVEPFHGSATGIGGIIRDVFTMGARPIALLDPLRFGPITNFYNPKLEKNLVQRNRYLMNGVTAGISFYGNCVGIPTVGGELLFHESYSLNPLMNGLCLGIAHPKELIFASARELGSKLVLVGAKTGRDGIQGATFASVELTEDVQRSRPAVQVGDPFLEKCLLEASLRLKAHPGLIGVQDLGAAGLTSSSVEMASRGGVGVRLYLDKVPLRTKHLSPYEIMLSESQERMLMVVKEEALADIYREFSKWGLDASVIGEVIEEKVVSIYINGAEVARLPVELLVKGAPVLERKQSPPTPPKEFIADTRIIALELSKRKLPANFPVSILCRNEYERALSLLSAHPNCASKRIVWEHYDRQVQINTVLDAETSDSAVLRIKGTKEGIALTTDGPAHLVAMDARLGGMHAVKEAYLNVLCSGAEPVAFTNCLNFASPEVPEVMHSFAECVEGMAYASRLLNTPVVSGNVSFYNETASSRIIPTPVIGMLGIVNDVEQSLSFKWHEEREAFLITSSDFTLAGSVILTDVLGDFMGRLVAPDLQFLLRLKDFILQANSKGLISSLHDIDSSGLLHALLECTLSGVGASLTLPTELLSNQDSLTLLFGYPSVGAIGTSKAKDFPKIIKLAEKHEIRLFHLGRTGGNFLTIYDGLNKTPLINLEVGLFASLYNCALVFFLTHNI